MPPDAEHLYEQAACGLLLTRTDGTIVRVNEGFCRWLDHAPEALVGRRLQDLLTIGGRVFHQTHWAPLVQMQGCVAEVKVEVLHRDGHTLPMLFNVRRARHGEETLDHVCAMVVQDRHRYERELLAERKKAEAAYGELSQVQQQLREADRRKDEFLATLAHELRNPLAPMRNVAELLRLKTLDDPQLRWARDVLHRQLSHMTHLVDDLLEVSRITQGKLELRLQPTELGEVIESAVEASRPWIAAARHRFEIRPLLQEAWLHADPVRLAQVLVNLLNNAAKYTPPGGLIRLECELIGQEVELRVVDSGIGIEPAHLPRVFEMFSQLEPALERAHGGLGIGLALVRGLVELHGGSIRAESAGAGRGSAFIVRLPLAPPAEAGARPKDEEARPLPAFTILVVDDNRDAAESLAMVLQMKGHTVWTAHTGTDALTLAEAHRPAVVLLDIGLPDLSGYAVAQRLRAQAWGAPMRLIAITGWGQAQDKQAAAEAGFDEHLTKPVDLDVLAETLGAASARQAR